MFRIASASKPLTALAVHQHMQRRPKDISPLDTMMSFFPTTSVKHTWTNLIRLRHIMAHRGGWQPSRDPMFNDVNIAAARRRALPIRKQDIFGYMTETQDVQHIPNTKEVYSNYGFMTLGLVLERLNPGLTYESIVKRDVFKPIGALRPRIGRSLLSGRLSGEVRYHPYATGVSSSVMSSTRPLVPGHYGGFQLEKMDAHGGWVMAAPDFARVFAAFDLGDRNPLLNKTWMGKMWSSYASSNPDTMQGWFRNKVNSGGTSK